MDQGSHMLGLVAADLPLGELGLGRQSAGGAGLRRSARMLKVTFAE
jgi:hypothetical protein